MTLKSLMQNICEISKDMEITGIACDSRKVRNGYAFVCIDGVAVDGHKYAPKALENGAAIIIAERDLGIESQIILSDTRSVWAKMSANWFDHPADKMKIIGITGTNGKTSSTYMMKHALEECGYKVGLIGTIQTLIGSHPIPACHTTPEAYELQSLFAQMVDAKCDYVVMEVSSHALAQCRVDGITFEAGVFTNLTQDHLDFHITMENYCDAKRKLFENSRHVFLNNDDSWVERMKQGVSAPIITYSCQSNPSDYEATNIVCTSNGVSYTISGPKGNGTIETSIPGKFTVYNSMGVIICLLELGLPFASIQKAFKTLESINGRAETVKTGKGFSVIIDYAHTPDGLEKICSSLVPGLTGRLITVFGAAGERDITKRPEMGEIVSKYSDVVVVTSDNPRSEDEMFIIEGLLQGIPKEKECKVLPDRFEAIKYGISIAKPGDTVLLAGKGHETYQVLKTGIVHLDERSVVAEALGMKNKWEMK